MPPRCPGVGARAGVSQVYEEGAIRVAGMRLCAAAVMVVCGLIQGFGAGTPLLRDAAGAPVDASALGIYGVARYRLVEVAFASLGEWTPDGRFEPAAAIQLNLFDDVLLHATLDQAGPGWVGGWLWTGTVDGPSPGTVVLAFNDHALSGTVELDGTLFQIRNDGGPAHLVREVAVPHSAEPLALAHRTPTSAATFELQVYHLTNQERVRHGLHMLAWNDTLAAAARAYALDLGQRDFRGHTCPDGFSCVDRMRDAGYEPAVAAENLAYGYTTAQAAVEGLMNSPPHRANILLDSVCDLGVGYAEVPGSTYTHHWTQKFGRLQGVTRCPPVDPPDLAGPALSVSPSSRSLDSASGSTTFAVANTGDGTLRWSASVTAGGDWLRITGGGSGTNAGTISVAFDANPGSAARTGRITVTVGGASGSPTAVTVVQAGRGAEPSPDPDPGTHSHRYGNVRGWYLFSVPVTARTVPDIEFWRWNPVVGEYERPGVVQPTHGTWALLSADVTMTLSGSPPASDVTQSLGVVGWHHVGTPWPYAKSAIVVLRGGVARNWAAAVAAGWVRNTLYGFKASDGAYTTPATLDPWYGYWLYARVSGLSIRFEHRARMASGQSVAGAGTLVALGEAGAPPPPPPDTHPLGAFTVGSFPSPATTDGPIRFQVLGPLAERTERIEVAVHALSGNVVWEGCSVGSELLWDGNGSDGRPLANGVYLYRVRAQVNETWMVSALERIAIFR